MKTLEQSSVIDDKVITSKNGRKFRPYYKNILDNMPSDLVKEMAKRELDKIEKSEKEKSQKTD
jgi:hypothetical protein